MKANANLLARARRLVFLAVIIAAIGLFLSGWGIWNKFNTSESFVSSGVVKSSKLEQLAGYPEPSGFKQINYDGVELTSQNSLIFETHCSDKYITALIFPADTDYREDPARAVVNKAFECPMSGRFVYEFSFADFKNLPHGKYYGFLADQSGSGLWYNPR